MTPLPARTTPPVKARGTTICLWTATPSSRPDDTAREGEGHYDLLVDRHAELPIDEPPHPWRVGFRRFTAAFAAVSWFPSSRDDRPLQDVISAEARAVELAALRGFVRRMTRIDVQTLSAAELRRFIAEARALTS